MLKLKPILQYFHSLYIDLVYCTDPLFVNVKYLKKHNYDVLNSYIIFNNYILPYDGIGTFKGLLKPLEYNKLNDVYAYNETIRTMDSKTLFKWFELPDIVSDQTSYTRTMTKHKNDFNTFLDTVLDYYYIILIHKVYYSGEHPYKDSILTLRDTINHMVKDIKISKRNRFLYKLKDFFSYGI